MNTRLAESQQRALTMAERHVQDLLASAAGDARLVRADRVVVAMSGPRGTRCLHTYSPGPAKPEARLALLLSVRLGGVRLARTKLLVAWLCGLVFGLLTMFLLVVVARCG